MELKEALKKMNPLDENQWNADGTAKMVAVRAIAGNNAISRDDVAKIAPDFSKDNPFINEEIVQENTQALAELMAETKDELEAAKVRLQVAQAEHAVLTKKLDHFMEEDAKLNPAPSASVTIQQYLARQRQDLVERGEQRKRIAAAGINLEELAKLTK